MSAENLHLENETLRRRLEEAEETLHAIRSGAVDAFVVEEPTGDRVYTLQGADRPYRLLVEQMQQGAATLYADGTIAYCNRRLADLLGVPHEKLIGSELRAAVFPVGWVAYDALLGAGRFGASQGETRMIRADGLMVPVYLTFNVMSPDSQAPIGVLITDLTAQKLHEELAAAQEALREADRRKDEFLAQLAHELRNPLAPIRNAVTLMRLKGLSEPDLERSRNMIDRQVSHLTRLIDDLLDVSRITRNKLDLRLERVELASVVRGVVESSRPLVESYGHELIVALPTEPIYLQADAVRLSQVFTNLLNNAAKYTDQGGRIWLTVERQGDEVAIRVRDNGIGISLEQIVRLFEMFYQVDRSAERAQSGLGIGLSLARRLVQMHGGSVEAHSDGPGTGSEFVVRLPVLAEAIEAPPRPVGDDQTVARPLRILVVDDNRDAADSLAMLLELSGHEIRTAYDGVAAVEAASAFRPDVVLLDIGLPKMSGHDAARRIREQSWSKSAVLVALTGWGQDDDRRKSQEAGFDHHIVKPVDPNFLTKLLASLAPR